MKDFLEDLGESTIDFISGVYEKIKSIDDHMKVFIIMIIWEALLFAMLFKASTETAIIFMLGTIIIGMLVHFDNKMELYLKDIRKKRKKLSELSNYYQNISNDKNLVDILDFSIWIYPDYNEKIGVAKTIEIVRTDGYPITRKEQKELLKVLNLDDESVSFKSIE